MNGKQFKLAVIAVRSINIYPRFSKPSRHGRRRVGQSTVLIGCCTCEAQIGMARAKANGIKIGRPKLEIEIRQKIAQRAAKGETLYAIAKALRIDRHAAAKYARMDT